jgi:hypothetical protein
MRSPENHTTAGLAANEANGSFRKKIILLNGPLILAGETWLRNPGSPNRK